MENINHRCVTLPVRTTHIAAMSTSEFANSIGEKTLPSASHLIRVDSRDSGVDHLATSLHAVFSACNTDGNAARYLENCQRHTHNWVFQTKLLSGSNRCILIFMLSIQSSNIKSQETILIHSSSALPHATPPPTHCARHGPFITNH